MLNIEKVEMHLGIIKINGIPPAHILFVMGAERDFC